MFSSALSAPEAGSDAAGMKTRAVRDADFYVLNGVKRWITNAGVSEYYTAFHGGREPLESFRMAALGFEVVTAANGAIAIEAVERKEFDVVLMDCQMPVMDGYDATRAIRRLESGTAKRTLVIAVTAYALDGDREKCLDAGMDDFLAKPYALSDLRPKLRRWLRTNSQPMIALSVSGSGADFSSR
jgi:CheY-like chemotaxis protein